MKEVIDIVKRKGMIMEDTGWRKFWKATLIIKVGDPCKRLRMKVLPK